MADPIDANDIQKLIADVNSVFSYHTKKLSDFPQDYQKRMINYYRFSANHYHSNEPYVVSRTTDTLDTV